MSSMHAIGINFDRLKVFPVVPNSVDRKADVFPFRPMMLTESTARMWPSANTAWRRSVKLAVLTVGFTKKQIFNSIVVPYSIFVMHNLSRFKIAANVLLHNKPVFKNSATTTGFGIAIRSDNVNIPNRRFIFSSFELWVQMWVFSQKFITTLSASRRRLFNNFWTVQAGMVGFVRHTVYAFQGTI